jgi:alpha-L-fucosidase
MNTANPPTRRSVLSLLTLLAVFTFTAQFAMAADSSGRMEWFNQARFGMFIHWGIYSVPAGEYGTNKNYAEWIQLQAKIPGSEYAKYAAQFDPTNFNAKDWVRVAKDAGMKYIVITAKHHDGFCMFDSKLTDYNIVKATPWQHDPMKDLARECKKAGITFCFYYSDPDWHHPEFPAEYSQHGFHGNPNPNADLEKYVTYMKGQIRELLTNYGPIGILWFDDGGSFRNTMEVRTNCAKLLHAQEIVDEIHQLQPKTLVNNRLGIPADYGTPEQKIPGARPTNSFEVCMTLNGHWGYNKNDHKWKDAKVVVQNLADIASKGGNYLLNVGPTSQGVFPPEAVQILGEVGHWMDANGDSIYGTVASPLDSAPSWGRITQKGNKLYLHVFDWPADGKLTVSGLHTKVRRAALLAGTRQKLTVEQPGANEIQIAVPTTAPDTLDSVIVLNCSGPIEPTGVAKN